MNPSILLDNPAQLGYATINVMYLIQIDHKLKSDYFIYLPLLHFSFCLLLFLTTVTDRYCAARLLLCRPLATVPPARYCVARPLRTQRLKAEEMRPISAPSINKTSSVGGGTSQTNEEERGPRVHQTIFNMDLRKPNMSTLN